MSAVRTARRSVPTPEAIWVWDALGDRSLPGRSLGQERRSRHKLAKLRRALGVGRFLRKRHVCGAGPLGDRSLPQRLFGYGTRSEMGPYRGGLRVIFRVWAIGLAFSGKLVGEPKPDERGTSGSVLFQPHCWVCLLWRQRGIVFVHTTNAARQ
jgi:hypothetical protein